MKYQNSILAVLFVGFLGGAIRGDACASSVINLPQITLELDQRSDEEVLRKVLETLLTRLHGHLPLPKTILIANDPAIGPEYDRGIILTKFPFYKNVYNEQNEVTKLSKSVEESAGITIHELGHHLVETWLFENYAKVDPRIIWSFYTRLDLKGEGASREYIEATKARAGLGNRSTEELMDLYFSISGDGSTFNEFLSDVVAAIGLEDADAIYRSVYFDEEDRGLAHYRRFDMDLTAADMEEIKGSEYDATIIAKVFLWREVYQRYRDGHLNVSLGEMLRRIFEATLAAFKESSSNFTRPSRPPLYLAPETMGRLLVSHFCKEFEIRPCTAPVIGAVEPAR